jgi:hypothetical protein
MAIIGSKSKAYGIGKIRIKNKRQNTDLAENVKSNNHLS